jgi:hypothetical protein
MRNVKLPEIVQPVVVPSNTASATSAIRPYLRTVDATTDFVRDAGTHIIQINLKLVDASGTAIRGVVDVSVITTGQTIINNGFGASVGTLQSNNNLTTTPVAWQMKYLTATTGILTATITLTGAGTASVAIQYGNQQVIVPALPVA